MSNTDGAVVENEFVRLEKDAKMGGIAHVSVIYLDHDSRRVTIT